MILNRNNFIRWYATGSELTLDRVRVGASGQCNPVPVWAVGDEMNIYFNHFLKSAPSGTVKLYNLAGSEISESVGSLTSLSITGGSHSYGQLFCPSVPAGIYRLGLGSLRSNAIRIVSTLPSQTMIVGFTHTGNLMSDTGSFLYKGTSIRQSFSIPLIAYEWDFDNSKEVYEESTTRKIRANNQRTRKWIKFKTEYLDDLTAEAVAAMLTHDTLSINGISVSQKDGTFLEKEYDPLEKLNHYFFTVYETQASLSSSV